MFRTHNPKIEQCRKCPIAKVADIVGDSWTILIVRDLLSGSKRFGELQTSLLGISTRTLTLKLKLLEHEGIIERKTFHEKPPRVEYSLTSKGKALHKVTEAMKKYGQKFL